MEPHSITWLDKYHKILLNDTLLKMKGWLDGQPGGLDPDRDAFEVGKRLHDIITKNTRPEQQEPAAAASSSVACSSSSSAPVAMSRPPSSPVVSPRNQSPREIALRGLSGISPRDTFLPIRPFFSPTELLYCVGRNAEATDCTRKLTNELRALLFSKGYEDLFSGFDVARIEKLKQKIAQATEKQVKAQRRSRTLRKSTQSEETPSPVVHKTAHNDAAHDAPSIPGFE